VVVDAAHGERVLSGRLADLQTQLERAGHFIGAVVEQPDDLITGQLLRIAGQDPHARTLGELAVVLPPR
jgi:hypothetical protein